MACIIVIFLSTTKKYHNIWLRAQISEHINSSNHKIHSYDQMRKIIVTLGSKKGNKYDDSSTKLTNIQNELLMSIVATHEKYLSHGEIESVTRKVCLYSVESS